MYSLYTVVLTSSLNLSLSQPLTLAYTLDESKYFGSGI